MNDKINYEVGCGIIATRGSVVLVLPQDGNHDVYWWENCHGYNPLGKFTSVKNAFDAIRAIGYKIKLGNVKGFFRKKRTEAQTGS